MKTIILPDDALGKKIQAIARQVKNTVPEYSTPPLTLIVGGYIRDLLLGLHPHDADMEVYGVSYKKLDSLLKQLFPSKVNLVGKSFGVFKIHLQNFDIDVALPRTDSKISNGHKGFNIQSNPELSIQTAMSRRDFTINSIAVDPLTGQIFDPHQGNADLRKKILRAVNVKAFTEDPLRIFRGLQLVARFGVTPEPTTLNLMRQTVKSGEIKTLSKERITEEFKKLLLQGDKPSRGLELARNIGLIKKYYPELQALIGCRQDPIWHPEGDVWNHTLLTLDTTARIIQGLRGLSENEKLQTMIGALTHDLGKPTTTSTDGKHIHSRGHEETGERLAKQFLNAFSFGRNIISAAARITGEHLKPRQLFEAKEKGELTTASYTNAVRRLLVRLQPASWRALAVVSDADVQSRKKYIKPQKITSPAIELFNKTILQNKLDSNIHRTLVTGKDITSTAKKLHITIAPGPIFKQLIQKIESQRDEGTIYTKDEALKMLQKLLHNTPTD